MKICNQSCSFGVLGFLWDLIQVLDMPPSFDCYYKGMTIVDVAHADHTFLQLQQFKSLSLSIKFDHTRFESQSSHQRLQILSIPLRDYGIAFGTWISWTRFFLLRGLCDFLELARRVIIDCSNKFSGLIHAISFFSNSSVFRSPSSASIFQFESVLLQSCRHNFSKLSTL